MLLASTTAAAGWLAEALQSHPHWSGALHRLGHGDDPLDIDPAPTGCRAVLVVRHPALEAIPLQCWRRTGELLPYGTDEGEFGFGPGGGD
ncbi:hypothetical protein [Cyanobium sp. ATX 6A2]|uniref:hypothetical protein n=1 Tax=Cyanobium sp. ATX 6A2 TaxID=2823700 RepID=UPI0020CF9F51|nr:hypothetical protein [Cyanobium sp. ATX 6A2]